MSNQWSLPEVKSKQDLAALALALETSSAAMYGELAELMRRRGRGDLATLFGRLREMENGHALELSAAAGNRSAAPPLAAGDTTRPEDLSAMTPYTALAWAVRREEHAFRLYAYLSAHAPDQDVRALAERLAKDELAHAALLRTARRLAYRREREDHADTLPIPSAGTIVSLRDLNRATSGIERRIGRMLAAMGTDEPAVVAASAATAEALSLLEPDVEAGREAPEEPHAGPLASAELRSDRDAAHRDVARWCDAAFSFYDSVAERAPSEPVLQRAQDLAKHALDRLVALHGHADKESA